MTALNPPDHGIYRCVTGAKIPRDQGVAGQQCPFCGRTLSLTPTVKDKTSRRPAPTLAIVLVVLVVVPILVVAAALYLGEGISRKFSEVDTTLSTG